MPSLRKRVSTYLRQLSFHNEPRDKRNNANENAFITKYLQGYTALREGPPIIYGKNPTDLPSYELGRYESGATSVIGCYSGPNGGLTTVKRTEKHLSVLDDDIDFIDNHEEEPVPVPKPKKSPQRISGQPIDNTTMVIKVAGNEYCVTNKPKRHSKSYSLGSIADFNIEVEKTKIDKEFYSACDKTKDENENLGSEAVVVPTSGSDNDKTSGLGGNTVTNSHKKVVRQSSESSSRHLNTKPNLTNHNIPNVNKNSTNNYALSKSRSDGNPFGNKKRGKIIQVQRQRSERGEDEPSILTPDDTALPPEWNQKSDTFYGISDSLYDRNQVTRHKNGDPIADCFGLVARGDSAILAVADGVNWGEKASVAAKSAIHASLHYLNKTIFNDTKPFEKLTVKTDQEGLTNDTLNPEGGANLVGNTREVFVCLLRAFNCAHDLILENKGMLTTLTVAVVLPLRPRQQAHRSGDGSYVCCVCNVGDTLAYVYSQKTGIRELTKGSHDVNSNRDMRDALGALGPVDGINPELSNLTLSITTLQKGDIVMVASDGLTDNFDPNVCKFTVNSNVDSSKTRPRKTSVVNQENLRPKPAAETAQQQPQSSREVPLQKPPVKPPRRSKVRVSSQSAVEPEIQNPLVAHFIRANSVEEPKKEPRKPPPVIENKASSLRKQAATQVRKITPPKTLDSALKSNAPTGYKFLKSKTALDLRRPPQNRVHILRNDDGIPYITPIQRYELQLLLMEDILKHGISGRDSPINTAKKLCESLVSFTVSISAAKRRTLEDQDMYFDNRNGVMVEVSNHEKKMRRKKGMEKVQTLPGKLDHVTVVAYNVGNVAF